MSRMATDRLDHKLCPECETLAGHLPLDYICLKCRLGQEAKVERCEHCHHPKLAHVEQEDAVWRSPCLLCECMNYHTVEKMSHNYRRYQKATEHFMAKSDPGNDDPLVRRLRRIDDRVDEWHEDEGNAKPLHAYLGWTRDEYKDWVESGELPPERPGAA